MKVLLSTVTFAVVVGVNVQMHQYGLAAGCFTFAVLIALNVILENQERRS